MLLFFFKIWAKPKGIEKVVTYMRFHKLMVKPGLET